MKIQRGNKKNVDSKETKKFIKALITILMVSALTISLAFNLFTYVFSAVRYYGNSMGEDLKSGQLLIVNRLAKINRGDVVAFYYNNKVLVRRVIAYSGDTVNIDAFGKVTVNGSEVDEPYAKNITLGQTNIKFPIVIGNEEYFMLGDDRTISMDSRLSEIGNVSKDRIIGQIIFQ